MRILTLYLCLLLIAHTPASAIFSEFVLIEEEGDFRGDLKGKPILCVNQKNPAFVDVKIPYESEGQAYWLVVANRALKLEEMCFRGTAWGDEMPKYLSQFVKLGKPVAFWGAEAKFIEFTILKSDLSRTFVYKDFDSVVDDGGYYYTFCLAKQKVEQVVPPKSDRAGG